MPNQQHDPAGKAADKPKLRHFRLRNRLKEMARGGSGGGGGKVSEELLELAAAEFTKMSEDYPDWVAGYIDSLQEAHRRAAEVTPDLRAEPFREINLVAHEMKGQGGTFGYPLISTFGKSRATAAPSGPNSKRRPPITALMASMCALTISRWLSDPLPRQGRARPAARGSRGSRRALGSPLRSYRA